MLRIHIEKKQTAEHARLYINAGKRNFIAASYTLTLMLEVRANCLSLAGCEFVSKPIEASETIPRLENLKSECFQFSPIEPF